MFAKPFILLYPFSMFDEYCR